MAGTVQSVHRKPKSPGTRGLPKATVEEIRATRDGVVGDFNRFRHEALADAPDQALLLLPIEVLTALSSEGWPVRPGDLGENVTTEGVPYEAFHAGDRFWIGEVLVEIAKPCQPCEYLEGLPYVGPERGPRFRAALVGRRGWFARIREGGRIRRGDPIARGSPDRGPRPSVRTHP